MNEYFEERHAAFAKLIGNDMSKQNSFTWNYAENVLYIYKDNVPILRSEFIILGFVDNELEWHYAQHRPDVFLNYQLVCKQNIPTNSNQINDINHFIKCALFTTKASWFLIDYNHESNSYTYILLNNIARIE